MTVQILIEIVLFFTPHLLFNGVNGFDDYFITVQMSTKNVYCESIITNHNVYVCLKNQYACDNFNIYKRSNLIQVNLDNVTIENYFKKHIIKIIKHSNNIIRRY